jgi:phospholipid/cholesterol/gamma-HCH transport system substrate-binding protein
MQRSKNDVWVGLFVLLGAAAILFLALKSANLLTLNFQSNYTVSGRFDNIGGLKRQAAVKSAGVVVGRVESVTFDDKTFQATVIMSIESRYQFPPAVCWVSNTSASRQVQRLTIWPMGIAFKPRSRPWCSKI